MEATASLTIVGEDGTIHTIGGNATNVIVEHYGWAEILFLVICILGLLGNLATLFVILVLQEYKKSITHWYVLQLTVADVIFLLTLPFKISEGVNGAWIYPEWMCKGKETILFLNFYASIFFLVIMTLDRYIAVCHPFSESLQRLRKKESAFIITIVIWIVSILICIPVMLFTIKTGVQPHCSCTYEFPDVMVKGVHFCQQENLGPEFVEKCLKSFGNITHTDETQNDGHCSAASINALAEQYGQSLTEYPGIYEGGYDDVYSVDGYGELYPEESLANYSEIFESSGSIPDVSDLAPRDSSTSDLGHPTCHYWGKPAGWRAFIAFNFSVLFMLPLLVMIACYGLILHRVSTGGLISGRQSSTSSAAHMMRTSNKGETRKRKNSCRSERDRLRMTFMSAVLVSSFIIGWLPFHAIHLAKLRGISLPDSHAHICLTLGTIGSILAYASASLSAYLYGFLGTKFSRRWQKAIRKSIRRGSSSSTGISMQKFKKKTNNSSNGPTLMSKVTRQTSEERYAPYDTQAGMYSTKTFPSEARPLNAIIATAPNGIENVENTENQLA